MTITTEQIRNIQGGLGAQAPAWNRSELGVTPAAGASGEAISAPNGVPSDPADGSWLTISTGEIGIYTALAVKATGLTSATIRWWGYYDGASQGVTGVTGWYLLDASERTITTSWAQLIPTGPITRIYCEVTAITGTSVTPYMGPSDLGGA